MMTRSSDAAITAINHLLPNRWILNSISVTEVDDYAVLLCPRGPVPIEDLGRVYGTGRTIRDALNDALEQLEAARRSHGSLDCPSASNL
jgi:hypothetical protein